MTIQEDLFLGVMRHGVKKRKKRFRENPGGRANDSRAQKSANGTVIDHIPAGKGGAVLRLHRNRLEFKGVVTLAHERFEREAWGKGHRENRGPRTGKTRARQNRGFSRPTATIKRSRDYRVVGRRREDSGFARRQRGSARNPTCVTPQGRRSAARREQKTPLKIGALTANASTEREELKY